MRGSSRIYHKPYFPLNCSELKEHPYICRLAPFADGFEIEILPMSDLTCTLFYSLKGNNVYLSLPVEGNTAKVTGLESNRDYELYVEASNGFRSKTRLVRTGEIPEGCTVVNYLHPEDDYYDVSGKFLCSPSLVRAPDGNLIAGMDVYQHRGAQNLQILYKSYDDGKNWSYLCDLHPFYWGALFVHRDELYMIGLSTEYGDFRITKSTDSGNTWSDAVTIFYGSNVLCPTGGMHRAPMHMVSYNGRLYTSCEYGSWATSHSPGVVSIDENDDLMVAENWTCTGFLPFEGQWAKDAGKKGDTIEGNVVLGPDGELYECLRWKIGEYLKLKIDKNDPEKPLRYDSLVKAPVSNSMFRLLPYKGKYLLFTNRKTDKAAQVSPNVISYRNVFSVYVSEDLNEFTLIKDVFNYEDYPADKIGFQYPVVVEDGDGFMLVVRSAFNGADTYHNSNFMLFLRISGDELAPYFN